MWILSISFCISFLLQAKPSPLTNKSKDALGRDLVRPSASISPVGVRTRVIAPASTYSLMAWYFIGICLDTQPVRKLMTRQVRLSTPKLGRDGAAGLTWQCVPVEGGGKHASALGAWCT